MSDDLTKAVRLAASKLGDLRIMATRGRASAEDVQEGNDAFEAALAALARQAPAPLSQAVPEGFWLAPMEPDHEMVKLACDRWGFPSGTRMVYVKGYQAARDSWLSRHPQPQAVPEDARDGERLADQIVREVSELGDRSSPEDWPEAMLVTAEELRQIVMAAVKGE